MEYKEKFTVPDEYKIYADSSAYVFPKGFSKSAIDNEKTLWAGPEQINWAVKMLSDNNVLAGLNATELMILRELANVGSYKKSNKALLNVLLYNYKL